MNNFEITSTSIKHNPEEIQPIRTHLIDQKGGNPETIKKSRLFTAIFFGALTGLGAGLIAGGAFSLATGGIGFGAIIIGGVGGALTGGLIGLISFLFKNKITNKNNHTEEINRNNSIKSVEKEENVTIKIEEKSSEEELNITNKMNSLEEYQENNERETTPNLSELIDQSPIEFNHSLKETEIDEYNQEEESGLIEQINHATPSDDQNTEVLMDKETFTNEEFFPVEKLSDENIPQSPESCEIISEEILPGNQVEDLEEIKNDNDREDEMSRINLSIDNEEDQMDRSGSIDKSEQDGLQGEQTLSEVKAFESDQIELEMDQILDPIKLDDHPVDFHLSSDVNPENKTEIINSSENFFYVADENDEKYLNDIRKYLASSDSKKPKANATDEEKKLGPKQFARDLNGMNYQIGINQDSSFRLEVGHPLDFVNKIKEVFGEAAFWNIAAIATQAFTAELAASMAKSYQQRYQIENLEDIAYKQTIKPECILEKKDESIKITFLVHLNLRSLDGPGIFYSGMKSVTMTFDDAITDWTKQSEAKELENSQVEKNTGWFAYLFAFLSSEPVKEETSGQDFSFAAPSLRIEDTLFSAMHRTNIEDAKNEVWEKMTLSQN